VEGSAIMVSGGTQKPDPLKAKKVRSVNIRLSEDEYQRLIGNCIAANARSVGEYARTVLCCNGADSAGSIESRAYLTRLMSGLETVEREVRMIGEQLGVLSRLTRDQGEPVLTHRQGKLDA
jgi:hypothetical protein